MKPRVRFLRYSLRTLMLLTAVIAVLLAMPIRQALTQKRGRDWVVSQNGHVSFSYKYNSTTRQWVHEATLPYPRWLIDATTKRWWISRHSSTSTICGVSVFILKSNRVSTFHPSLNCHTCNLCILTIQASALMNWSVYVLYCHMFACNQPAILIPKCFGAVLLYLLFAT